MKALVIDQMIVWLIYVFREITHPMLFYTIGSVGCKHLAFWNVIMMVRSLSMQSNLSDRYERNEGRASARRQRLVLMGHGTSERYFPTTHSLGLNIPFLLEC